MNIKVHKTRKCLFYNHQTLDTLILKSIIFFIIEESTFKRDDGNGTTSECVTVWISRCWIVRASFLNSFRHAFATSSVLLGRTSEIGFIKIKIRKRSYKTNFLLNEDFSVFRCYVMSFR